MAGLSSSAATSWVLVGAGCLPTSGDLLGRARAAEPTRPRPRPSSPPPVPGLGYPPFRRCRRQATRQDSLKPRPLITGQAFLELVGLGDLADLPPLQGRRRWCARQRHSSRAFSRRRAEPLVRCTRTAPAPAARSQLKGHRQEQLFMRDDGSAATACRSTADGWRMAAERGWPAPHPRPARRLGTRPDPDRQ